MPFLATKAQRRTFVQLSEWTFVSQWLRQKTELLRYNMNPYKRLA